MSVLQFPVPKPRAKEQQYHQFPKPARPEPAKPQAPHPLKEIADEQQGRFTIQGKSATDLEMRVYNALIRAGYDASQIQFQVGLLGGRNFRGGIVVDFVLNTEPNPTAIWVNGGYWHSGQFTAQDWITRRRFIDEVGMFFNDPVDLWEYELLDDDMAYYAVLDKIGLA